MNVFSLFLLLALIPMTAVSAPNADTSLQATLDRLGTLPERSLQNPEDIQRFLSELSPTSRAPTPPLQIFVSLTLPQSSLIPLLRQASDLGAPVMIRGVLPQGFKATIDAVYQLMSQMQRQDLPPLGGVSIDPQAFTTWHVTRVPTFILQGTTKVNDKTDQSHADRLMGNLTPIAALKQFAISGEHSDLARSMLDSVKDPPDKPSPVTLYRSDTP